MSTISRQALSFSEFQEYAVKGALDLFAAYGVPVEHSLSAAAVRVEGAAIMAVIGYAAPTVRGAVLLLASREVVMALRPPELRTGPPSEPTLRDTLGEFCNMLIGRLKNQLVTRNVAPLLSTPTTIFGDDLQVPAPVSGMSAWHRFTSAAGEIFVRLDATFDADFALGAIGDPGEQPLAEGETLLF
jgi:hypothetical protein